MGTLPVGNEIELNKLHASADGVAIIPGALETQHIKSKRYQNVIAGDASDKLTVTHWNIALAAGFGWFLDSMSGALYALIIPYLLIDFDITLNFLTLWVTISGVGAVATTYFWPWWSDRIGRRPAFTINITLTGIFVILTASAHTWLLFIVFFGLARACLNGEWSIAANLTAETWPAKYRSKVLSVARSLWGFGVALAGVIGIYIIAPYGWHWGYGITAVIAVIALFFRMLCPESPHWVRTQDRKARIRKLIQAGVALPEEDRVWLNRVNKAPLRQLFASDQIRLTLAATFVTTTGIISFIPFGTFAPLFLSETHHWSVAQYSSWYVWFGIFGTVGYWFLGWVADRWSRFAAMLIGNTITIATIVPFSLLHGYWTLWILGCMVDFGLIGVWGVIMTYTAELFPTRIRGAGSGFAWTVAGILGFGTPYAAVLLRDFSGSFTLPFLIIVPILCIQIIGLWLFKVEYAGRALDSITT